MTGLLIFLAMLLSGRALAVEPTPTTTVSFSLSTDGWGPVRIGMSPSEAKHALGGTFQSTLGGPHETACFLLQPSKYPHVSFMVTDGRISRIDIDTKSFVTREGIRLGDSEAKIKHLYGRKLTVMPHPYTDGHYFVVRRVKGSARGYVFESDGTIVTTFRAGKFPEIEFIEGCE